MRIQCGRAQTGFDPVQCALGAQCGRALTHHFWQKWSLEYLTSLSKHSKWHHATRNLRFGDVVLLREGTIVPTKWPLGKVIQTHPGEDQFVHVVTVKTAHGVFKRPVVKVALLLSQDEL